MAKISNLFVALAAAAALAACSGDGGLTTSSLLGSPKKAALDEPTERAVLAGTTAARAAKCGFNFDPVKHKEAYLASETTRGTAPDQMVKLGQSYDFTRESVAKRITNAEEYCSPDKTRDVGNALKKQLAGDYSAPRKPDLPKSASWWSDTTGAKALDREEIFNPRHSR